MRSYPAPSAGARRAAATVAALVLVLALPGCRNLGRSVRKEAPPAEFVTPVAPTGRPGMTLPDIRQTFQERRGQIKSAQAAMTLTIGSANSRGRQQFDASVYSRPAAAQSPELLRVRGSADAGPVFDFLLNRNEVQAVVYPEQKFYRGSLTSLQQNPQLLAGVQPHDLADSFLVERTLYQRMRENREAPLRETETHYILSFLSRTGLAEHFYLRKADLLVDQIERAYGEQLVSSVRYFGYRVDDETGGLVPTRYDAAMATTGAELSVNVGQVRFNAEPPENVDRMTVPDGFDRMQL